MNDLMKKIMKTKLLYVTVVFGMMLGFASCDLNYFPSDELNSNVLLSSEAGAEYIVDGCYAMMKEEYEYVEYASGNSYVRHYMMDTEYPSDNICLANQSSDPLSKACWYKMSDHLKNIETPWWIAYKVIYSANTVIENFKEGESASGDQLIGEAYFLRAMMHFHMVTLFAKQYTIDPSAPGVPLRISSNTEVTTRASVKEVYEQVVADLRKASELMNAPRHSNSPGYATKNTALGLLSRVYLYMDENQKVLDVIKEMGEPTSYLDQDITTYFAKALTSKETLLAIVHTVTEDRTTSSIGAMYNADGGCWGEVYPSTPLLYLYNRYPEDKRCSYIKPQEETDTRLPLYGKPTVVFPYKSGNIFRDNLFAEILTDAEGQYCEFKDENQNITKYRIYEMKVNGMNEEDPSGEYSMYYVNYDGEKVIAQVYDKFPEFYQGSTFPRAYITKFGYQDGSPTLSSPVFLRWAEIVLNRAEANAKLGNDAAALADVNAIRSRAGLSGVALFDATNMHGYTSVLDVVLDERRMELAFEGHRRNDVYRNKRDMDRRYAGTQPWEVIPYTADKIQYPIPFNERSVSGIEQNPGY